MLFFVGLFFCAVSVRGIEEGDPCSSGDVNGVCINLNKCPSALEEIKNRRHPQLCTFKNKEPLVCCVDSLSKSLQSGNAGGRDKCGPIPFSLTTAKTGRKAWNKCIEYQEQLIFPCGNMTNRNGVMVRQNLCSHNNDRVSIADSHVNMHEYPHMALLGYGKDVETLEWLCGGTLISDKFILTAAHCTRSKELGPVSHVALNTLDRTKINSINIHAIKSIIAHPEFVLSMIYHDIALLELETPITLSSATVPACLHTDQPVRPKAVSTTWNTHDVLRTNSTVLQKIALTKFTDDECSVFYPPHKKRGKFDESTHVCYGVLEQTKNICADDGGSPVVVENDEIACMYTIVAITSLGKGCLGHSPGLYTKVEHYIPWIESVVWP